MLPALFLIALLPPAVPAQNDAASSIWGPPLSPIDVRDAPGATQVITSEEIAASAADNVFELLRRVAGLDVRYTPMGGHLGIRGTGSSPFTEQVLLLVDGIPFNSPDKGGFPGHPSYDGYFPLHRIERIEVVKGPISVTYGSNAYGGVVNIVSRKSGDTILDAVSAIRGGAQLRAGGEGRSEASAWVDQVIGPWETSFEAGYGQGPSPIALYEAGDVGYGYFFGSARRNNLRGTLFYRQADHKSFDFRGVPTHEAQHQQAVAGLHYERLIGKTTLSAGASLNIYRGTTCGVCHNATTGPPDDAHTSSIAGEREEDQRLLLQLRADRLLTPRQDLTLGVEVASDHIERDVVKLAGAPDALLSGSFYAEHQLHLRRRSLHLLSGARVDTVEDLGSSLSPRLALGVAPLPQWQLRASVSRAYRAPTWNERFIQQRFLPDTLPGNLIVVRMGNPDLSRERIDSIEAGFSWRLSSRATLRADVYSNRISDFIFHSSAGVFPGSPRRSERHYFNRDEPFDLRGGEVVLEVRPSDWVFVRSGFVYRDSSLAPDDPNRAYFTRSGAMLTVLLRPADPWRLSLDVRANDRYSASLGDLFGPRWQPGYELVDVAIRRRLPWAGGRFEIGLMGRNLLDEEVFETLVEEAIDSRLRGRYWMGELRVRF
jgi:outer membrane receptor for ferrienterochelin and colicins